MPQCRRTCDQSWLVCLRSSHFYLFETQLSHFQNGPVHPRAEADPSLHGFETYSIWNKGKKQKLLIKSETKVSIYLEWEKKSSQISTFVKSDKYHMQHKTQTLERSPHEWGILEAERHQDPRKSSRTLQSISIPPWDAHKPSLRKVSQICPPSLRPLPQPHLLGARLPHPPPGLSQLVSQFPF